MAGVHGLTGDTVLLVATEGLDKEKEHVITQVLVNTVANVSGKRQKWLTVILIHVLVRLIHRSEIMKKTLKL